MKTSSLAWFMPLALAGSLAHAADPVVKPAEVEVCTAALQPLMTDKTGTVLSCSSSGLGRIRISEAYARGWRVKAMYDSSALCNSLSPCLVLVLER